MNHEELKIISPGIWCVIHSMSFTIKNYEDYENFIDFMNWIKFYFPCEKCRVDMNNYMNQHPLPSYENGIIKNLSMYNWRDVSLECFEWTFNFHNYVNEKLKKPIIEIDEAYDITTALISGCETRFCKL